MDASNELYQIATKLEGQAATLLGSSWIKGLVSLESAARQLDRSASGSWLGYHANVYYEGLRPAPPGAHFSQEWGLMDTMHSQSSNGEWVEYDPAEVRGSIEGEAGFSDLAQARSDTKDALAAFDDAKANIVSILSNEIEHRADRFLSKLLEELEPLESLSPLAIADRWHNKGQVMTRDTTAVGQGTRVPPHVLVKAEVASLKLPQDLCERAAKIARKAGSHLERKAKQKKSDDRIGTNVFIGHGRSSAWRELKDFVKDRLALPHDEFNRVPVAGITNIARLSEMLDSAAVAFVIMTAEDERADGKMQARMNVIHEVGLFQGRLGFTKAIVLLEEGCEEFTNIQGLGQVRFPAGRISAIFEDIRAVLEREGVVDAS
ncbi:hypothetical protein Amn_45330 [Aminobacter sp. Y103A]|nr:hypothetical protein Amn_45330 [Aminobacter sp. SS-2016]